MLSTRKRPLILGGMFLPAVVGPSRLSRVQEAAPATPAPPSPPDQPATGPGGADYAYDDVTATAYRDDGSRFQQLPGEAIPHFWLFEPADPRPGAPAVGTPLPVVIVLPECCDYHRFATNRPGSVRSWIDHLVRRGAVVIYPMGAGYILGTEATPIRMAVSDALAELDDGDHVPVDPSRVAVVGLQLGGAHAVNLVAVPPDGLPIPTALLLVAPFLPPEDTRSFEIFQIAEAIESISATTHVVLVGAEDLDRSGRDDGLDQV